MQGQALALFRECVEYEPTFKPSATQVVALSRLLIAEQDENTALRVMSRFDVENPRHPHTAQVYYLCASVMVSMDQPTRASHLLKLVIDRFPNEKIADDARTLLASLEPKGGSETTST
jgi:outer membrane protein assembly factor BamD (BamD/ComL family)